MTPAVRAALKACWHAFLDEQSTEEDPTFGDRARPCNLECCEAFDSFDNAWLALVALVGEQEADRLWQIDRSGDEDFA